MQLRQQQDEEVEALLHGAMNARAGGTPDGAQARVPRRAQSLIAEPDRIGGVIDETPEPRSTVLAREGCGARSPAVMITDFIVFTIDGEPWKLTHVCWVSALVLFVLCGVMMTLLLRRFATGRILSQPEAARVAMHPAETSYVDQTLAASGPAMGKEWRVSMSIGDFRRAWHQRDYFAFLVPPSVTFLGCSSFGVLMFGMSVHVKSWGPFGAASLGLVPLILINFFMLWAAIYTKLD